MSCGLRRITIEETSEAERQHFGCRVVLGKRSLMFQRAIRKSIDYGDVGCCLPKDSWMVKLRLRVRLCNRKRHVTSNRIHVLAIWT
jgi:hypothetical protein